MCSTNNFSFLWADNFSVRDPNPPNFPPPPGSDSARSIWGCTCPPQEASDLPPIVSPGCFHHEAFEYELTPHELWQLGREVEAILDVLWRSKKHTIKDCEPWMDLANMISAEYESRSRSISARVPEE